jgi:hypothetical protein
MWIQQTIRCPPPVDLKITSEQVILERRKTWNKRDLYSGPCY